MAKAKKQAAKSLSLKSQQWASQVISITENTQRGGTEIRFDAEPSPLLQPKLRVMGFRNSRVKTMWYGDKDTSPEARQFARQLKEVLPLHSDGPPLLLSPSAEAIKTNLEKKAFSFVMFTLKDGQNTNYLVFEPSKPRAEVIAYNFAQQQFGDSLQALAVLPKTRIREARTLFDEGRIIYPGGQMEQNPDNNVQQPGAKTPLQSIFVTAEAYGRKPDFSKGLELSTWKEADAYVRSKIDTHFPNVYYKIKWQSGDLFGGIIDLEPASFYDNDNMPLSRHIRTYLTNYSKVEKQDPFYNKEGVEYAKHLLTTCALEDSPEIQTIILPKEKRDIPPIVSADDQQELQTEALRKFYKWSTLTIKSSEITLEMMTKWFQEHMPELSDAMVQNIWKEHQGIQKSMEIKVRKRNLRFPYDSIYKKILKVIPGLLEGIKNGKTAGKSKVDPEGGLMALNYDFLYYDKNGYPIIALSHYYKQSGDLVADPDMQIRLIPEMEIAEALTFQDQFRYQEVYFEKEGKTYMNRRLHKSLNSFLNQWLTNILQQGHRIDLSENEDGVPDATKVPDTRDFPNADLEKELWIFITQFLPDLKLIPDTEQEGKTSLDEEGHHFIQAALSPYSNGTDFRLHLTDTREGIELLRAYVQLQTAEQRAKVYSIALSGAPAKNVIQNAVENSLYGRKTDYAGDLNADLIGWLTPLLEKGLTLSLTIRPNDKEPAPVVFEPRAMASLILSQNYLLNAWALSHAKDLLQNTSFSYEDTIQLQAFFTIYVEQDQPLQIKYKAVYDELNKQAAEPKQPADIIRGLEDAYWQAADEVHPHKKVVVNGQAFEQGRLSELIGAKLEILPLNTLKQIRVELAGRFKERRPFHSYEQALLSPDKKGDERMAALTVMYIEDIMTDHDLKTANEAPVAGFLVDLLFSESPRLADAPLNSSGSGTTTKNRITKKQSQYQLNKEIEKFIDEKDKTEAYYTEQEKNYIRQYSGSGGLLSEGAKGRGTLYEYYTPDAIVARMWDMAYHYGYDGGSILEPAVGTGNFLKYAPKNAAVFAFETNHYSCRIAQILYPHAQIYEKAFETHFFTGNIHLKDKFLHPGYSLAIGNPPYGEFAGKYAGLGEKQYTGAKQYDQYFIVRSLDLLKPGGLLVFLIASSFLLSETKYNLVKEKIHAKAELVDAYRFPEKAVPYTDVGTDILVLRKRRQMPINKPSEK